MTLRLSYKAVKEEMYSGTLEIWGQTGCFLTFFCLVPPATLAKRSQGTRRLVGAVGIEPTTFGLKGRCSTTELRPYKTVTTSYLKTT